MKKILLVIILCFTYSLGSWAQDISPTTFDFGKVEDWNNPVAELTLTNNTSEAFYVLPVGQRQDLQIEIPQGKIQPGQVVKIKFRFYTEEGGRFSETLPIHFSSLPHPIHVYIKGNIASFHPDALTQCPSLTDPIRITNKNPVFVHLTDQATGKPVYGANVIIENPEKKWVVETHTKLPIRFNGLPPGIYNVTIDHPNYQLESHQVYLNRQNDHISYDLNPKVVIAEQSEIVPDPPPSENTDDIVYEIPVSDTGENGIEHLRNFFNEKFKDKEIIEKDVVVIKPDSTEEPEPPAPAIVIEEVKPSNETTVTADSISEIEIEDIPVDYSLLEDFNAAGELNPDKFKSNNLVFLIDVSGSMYPTTKLPVLKEALKELITILRAEDQITIVTYSNKTSIKLAPTSAAEIEKIFPVIDSLTTRGSSYGTEGLNVAYLLCKEQFISEGNNHIILASDGMFNSDNFSEDNLKALAKKNAQEGIRLSTFFFGKKKSALKFMKTLSSYGKGSLLQLPGEKPLQELLVEEVKKYALRK